MKYLEIRTERPSHKNRKQQFLVVKNLFCHHRRAMAAVVVVVVIVSLCDGCSGGASCLACCCCCCCFCGKQRCRRCGDLDDRTVASMKKIALLVVIIIDAAVDVVAMDLITQIL